MEEIWKKKFSKIFNRKKVTISDREFIEKVENISIKYYKGKFLHRDGDKPAIIYNDGSKKYYKEGLLHRDGDKPQLFTL